MCRCRGICPFELKISILDGFPTSGNHTSGVVMLSLSSTPKTFLFNMPETSEISNATDFSEQMMGSCLCRSIVVTIVDSDLFTTPRGHLCHCENCRKLSGSYVSSNLLLSDEKVRLEDQSGSLTKYTDTETESGTPAYRYFCSRCGT
jgi:hypothetical protein